jgi:hypothetical protein
LEKIQGLGEHLGALRIDPGDGGEHAGDAVAHRRAKQQGSPFRIVRDMPRVSASRRRVRVWPAHGAYRRGVISVKPDPSRTATCRSDWMARSPLAKRTGYEAADEEQLLATLSGCAKCSF